MTHFSNMSNMNNSKLTVIWVTMFFLKLLIHDGSMWRLQIVCVCVCVASLTELVCINKGNV